MSEGSGFLGRKYRVGFSSVLIALFVAVCALPVLGLEPAATEGAKIARVDKAVKQILKKYQIPGATIAVMKETGTTVAAVDAGRKVSLMRRLGQPLDHPVSLHHPEGEYLKGLVVRVLD